MSLYKHGKSKHLIAGVVLAVIFIIVLLFGRNITFEQKGATVSVSGLVQVIATTNYGEEELFNKKVNIETTSSAFQVLSSTALVSTNYGGGFVNSINNISSTFSDGFGKKDDWFYYVNGLLSPVGALHYRVVDGDVIRWDYHHWGELRSITAVVADFPEPFLHGFQGKILPTTIVYEKDCEQQAYQIQSLLMQYGVQASCIVTEQVSSDVKASHNLILLGTYANHEYIQEINTHASELGVYVEWVNGYLEVFDVDGNSKDTYRVGGVIAAVQNFWNPKGTTHGENVVWMITGLSSDDVNNTVDILTN